MFCYFLTNLGYIFLHTNILIPFPNVYSCPSFRNVIVFTVAFYFVRAWQELMEGRERRAVKMFLHPQIIGIVAVAVTGVLVVFLLNEWLPK